MNIKDTCKIYNIGFQFYMVIENTSSLQPKYFNMLD